MESKVKFPHWMKKRIMFLLAETGRAEGIFWAQDFIFLTLFCKFH